MKSFLLFILIFAGINSFSQTDEEYDAISDSLLLEKHYNQIFEYFLPELEKFPKNEKILRVLGYTYMLKEEYKVAGELYLRAIDLNPICTTCYINLGNIYANQNNYEKAISNYNIALELDPVNVTGYLLRAQLYGFQNNKYGAIMDYKKAIEIEPENADCYLNRGIFNLGNNYPELALSDFNKAIELDSNSYYSYFQRSSLYYNQQKLDLALNDIDKAIELDSTQAQLYISRGAIHSIQEDKVRAFNDYSRSISLDSTYFLGYLNRALIYYQFENLDSSCIDNNKCKELMDKYKIQAPNMRKEVESSLANYCDCTRPSYYYQRGVALYNLEQFSESVKMYNDGLRKFPNNGMIWSFKGNAQMVLFEFDSAIVAYKTSLKYKESIKDELKLNPRFEFATQLQIYDFYQSSIATIHISLGECYYNLGKYDEALQHINKAIKILPPAVPEEIGSLYTYYKHRGLVYLALGQYDLALQDFEKSIYKNEKYAVAYICRAITKVCISEKITTSKISSGGKLKNQPLSIRWELPTKSELKKSKINLLSALKDCDRAIELDSEFGFAYFIRGQIKQMLGESDYCMDYVISEKYGVDVESELDGGC